MCYPGLLRSLNSFCSGRLFEPLMANDTVKSEKAPWLLDSLPGKTAGVGQECVNSLKSVPRPIRMLSAQAALILAKELKQPICPTVARRDLVGDEIHDGEKVVEFVGTASLCGQ